MRPDDGLRVVIRPDCLAYAVGRSPPERSTESPARILSGWAPGRLLAVGHVSQRRLLEAAIGGGWSVWTASGAALGVPDPTVSPEATVYRMLGCSLPASVGGWHHLSTDHAHLLSGEIEGFSCHPVARLMGFVRGLEPAWLWRVMSHVIDPRWYIDPFRPDSPRRLFARLGIFPQRRASYVAVAVRQCWMLGLAAGGGLSVATSPGSFILREYSRVMDKSGDQATAWLRASALFARFLRSVWLAHLFPGDTDLYAPHLILPDNVAPAYRAHSARVYASSSVDGRRAAG